MVYLNACKAMVSNLPEFGDASAAVSSIQTIKITAVADQAGHRRIDEAVDNFNYFHRVTNHPNSFSAMK